MNWIFRTEKEARDWRADARLELRQSRTKLHWDDLHAWLLRERQRVPDGSGIAGAINYSLNCWAR